MKLPTCCGVTGIFAPNGSMSNDSPDACNRTVRTNSSPSWVDDTSWVTARLWRARMGRTVDMIWARSAYLYL